MNRVSITAVALSAFLSLAPVAYAGDTPSPAGASVSFANLKDGDTVSSPVKISFVLEGMEVTPAGTEMANSGHHHIFLNRPPLGEGPDGADELDANIPADDNHIHFGKGQTETELELPAGTHTLQLVLGDANHIPHDPPVVSEVITITVE